MKKHGCPLIGTMLMLAGCASAAPVKDTPPRESLQKTLASALLIDAARCENFENTAALNTCLNEVDSELGAKIRELGENFSAQGLKTDYEALLKSMEKSCTADAAWSAARFEGGSMASSDFSVNDLYCKRDFMVRFNQILKLPPLNSGREEFEKSDRELNQWYQKLLSRHGKEAWAPAKQKFVQAEKAWIQYRDQWSSFLQKFLKNQQASPSLWNQTNMTQSRTQRFQDEIEEFDSLFGV